MKFGQRSIRMRPLGAACAVVAVVALIATGCSGSSGGGGTASGNAAAQAKAAAAIAANWEKPPTKLAISQPLKTKPPTGKTFVWLNCEIPSCKNIGAGVTAAAEAAGWTVKTVQYNETDVSSLISAFKLALNYHPTAVGLAGLPEAVWASVIPEYKKAGVVIVPCYVGPIPLNSTVIGNIGGPPDGEEHGTILANWFIGNSKAKGHALSVRTDDLPSLKVFNDTFDKVVKSKCSDCKVTDLNIPYADVSAGKANSAVVSALQRDSSIDYVVATEGPFIDGLPAALSAAGLSKQVKIAGENSDVENLTDVKKGTEDAWTGAANTIAGWQIMDVVFRHVEGMKFDPYDGVQPKQLLTRSVSFTPTNNWNEPANYPDLFKSLWKLS